MAVEKMAREPSLEDLANLDMSEAEIRAILEGKDLDEYLADALADVDPDLRAAAMRAIEDTTPAELDDAVLDACRQDFRCFLKYEMGLEVADCHEEWADLLETGDDACILAPRDHGKSLTCVRAYAIWKAKYDPWVREIYVLGADQESAIDNLTKIKELMLSLRTLRGLMPANVKQGLNNKTTLRTSNGTLIRAKSFFTRMRGRHPQLILCDDVLNELNSATEQARRQVRDLFGAVIIPMKDKGTPRMRADGYRPQAVVIGTAQSADDLYHHMLGRTDKTGPGPALGPVRGVKQSAILCDEEWDPILTPSGERQSLWPGRYSVSDLDAIKADPRVGTLLFEREYMNKPIVDEMSIFPPSLFRPMFDRDLSYVPAYPGPNPTYLGVDFSVPGNMDGDWTVVFALMYEPQLRRYTPLNYWRARPSEVQQQLHQIEYFAQAYSIQKGYLESNVFQRIYAEEFRRRTSLPLDGLATTGTLKNSYLTGILGLRPLFELGTAWRFPYKTDADREKTDVLVREFGGIIQKNGKIGNEAGHDDVPMALWMAWRAAQDAGGAGGWTAEWSLG